MADRCAICDRRIRGGQWVCKRCSRQYGLDRPYAEWPDWAKAAANAEQAVRRTQAAETGWQVTTGDGFPVGRDRGLDFELLAPNDGDALAEWARPVRVARERRETLPLPYAPYGDPELDRQYRRANRIPERA